MSAHPVRGRIAAVISALALLAVVLGAGVAASQASAAPAPAAAAAAAPTAVGTVVPVTPCRVADSRNGWPIYTFAPGQTEFLGVSTVCGIPYGVSGAVLDITVVPTPWGSNGGGYLTLYPDSVSLPLASQVSYNWYTVTTEVTTQLSPWGWMGIYNGTGSTWADVIVDAVAYIN